MQSNKSSKKSRKITESAPSTALETNVAAEVQRKPRTSRSSAPKTIEVGTETPTHHHKLSASPVAEALAAVSESSVIHQSLPQSVVSQTVTRQQVAEIAYSFWANRGYSGGSPEEDWFRAERQLTGAATN